MKRTRIKPRGHRSLRESKPTPDQDRLLDLFWAKAVHYQKERLPHLILKMLQEYEKIDGRKTSSRYNFDRWKGKIKLGQCFMCMEDATERHHILPLARGGPNCEKNIIPLCGGSDGCHAKIHPHLEERNA